MSSWKELQSRLPTDEELELCRKPGMGVGLITGLLSRVAVVDLDGPEGLKTAKDLGLSSPLTAISGGEGRHLFYQMPLGLKNSVKELPGLDIRAEGGFLVLSPSIHPSGRSYRWLSFAPNALPLFPTILLQTEAETDDDKPLGNEPGWLGAAIKAMADGNIDNTLFKVLSKLRRDGWTEGDAFTLLDPHARAAGATPDHLPSKIDHVWKTYQPAPTSLRSEATMGGMVLPDTLAAESLSLAQVIETKAPVDWVIDGVIPTGTVTVISGPPGAGKSCAMIDMALELASPKPSWFGTLRGNPRRILYIDEESALPLFADRLGKFAAAKGGVDPERIQFLVGQRMTITNPDRLAVLERKIEEFKPDVVMFDSFGKIHDSEENDKKAMRDVAVLLKTLREKYSLSLVVIDHSNKGVFQKLRDGGVADGGDLSGSIEKLADADQVFEYWKKGDHSVMYQTKARWTDALPPQIITLANDGTKSILRSIEHASH